MLGELKAAKESIESYGLRVQSESDVLLTIKKRVEEMTGTSK